MLAYSNVDRKQKMKAIFYLAFYMFIYLCPSTVNGMKLDFQNDTDNDIILESSVSRYSSFPEGSKVEDGENFVMARHLKSLELTIVSGSYFDHIRAKAGNGVGNQNNRDRLCLKIGDEEFIVYWDFVESSTTWKPKVFQTDSESSRYLITMTSSKRTASCYTFLIQEKSKIKALEPEE